jgi:preprotein translocase subunit SecE
MTSPLTFVQQTYDELKRVVWPTKEQLFRLTFVVLAISVVVGVYIGGIDFVLTKLTEELVK